MSKQCSPKNPGIRPVGRRTLNQAFPTRRFQSTWMGLITHTAPSFLTVSVVATLVF